MKTLLRFAIGAAVAGALVHYFTKQRSSRAWSAEDAPADEFTESTPGTGGFTVEELAGEDREWGGGGSGLNS